MFVPEPCDWFVLPFVPPTFFRLRRYVISDGVVNEIGRNFIPTPIHDSVATPSLAFSARVLWELEAKRQSKMAVVFER